MSLGRGTDILPLHFPNSFPRPLSLISQPKSFDSLSHFIFFLFLFRFFFFVSARGWEFEMGGLVWDMCVLVGWCFAYLFLLLDWRVWGCGGWIGGEV